MEFSAGTLGIMLLVAAVVAMLARRLHAPYGVGLVVAGVALGYFHVLPGVVLTKDLFFTILLPPLIFEAAFHLHWKELRREMPLVVVLATVGVFLSAAVTAAGLHFAVAWGWKAALLFGVLIAATDPVSVIAIFKDAGATGRLSLLVEAESLFNDGTAAVAFGAALALASGTAVDVIDIGKSLLMIVGGGILTGAIVAGGTLLLAGRTEDPLVELTFTTIGAYSSFLLAEHYHFSGVLATLTTGLMLGNVGPLGPISTGGREAVESFWEYATFVANSFVFLLIGMEQPRLNFSSVWLTLCIAIVVVEIGRAAAIYPICYLFSRSSLRVSSPHQHILFWGGLRGTLALALVLGLPANIPRREEIITVTFGVVAFSILAQGLTIAPLLRRLGELTRRRR